jgi:hypothetical protein
MKPELEVAEETDAVAALIAAEPATPVIKDNLNRLVDVI